jgi:hypothetical protein
MSQLAKVSAPAAVVFCSVLAVAVCAYCHSMSVCQLPLSTLLDLVLCCALLRCLCPAEFVGSMSQLAADWGWRGSGVPPDSPYVVRQSKNNRWATCVQTVCI